MSEDQGKKKRKRREREGGEEKRGGLALWQIAVLVGAVVVMGVGIALGVMAGGGGGEGTGAVGAGGGVDPSGLVRGLAPVEGQGQAAAAAEGGTDWSPVVFRLGFSAFAGFAIGYALRSFMRFSLFALGFFFLLLLGLEYAQIIEVRWANLEDRYDDATTWIGSQTQGITAFVTGQLPSAGLAIAGLVAGVKRR